MMEMILLNAHSKMLRLMRDIWKYSLDENLKLNTFIIVFYRSYYNTPTAAWTYPNFPKPHTVNKMLPRPSTSGSNIKPKYFFINPRNVDIGNNKDFAHSAKWYISFHLVCFCARLVRNEIQRRNPRPLQNSSLPQFQ